MKIYIECTAASKHPMHATLVKLLRASKFKVLIHNNDLYVSSINSLDAIEDVVSKICWGLGLSIRYRSEKGAYIVYTGPSVVAYIYPQQRLDA